MKGRTRFARWVMLVASAGILPAVVMRCDKAALNFQRGLYEGLGHSLSALVFEQAVPDQGA